MVVAGGAMLAARLSVVEREGVTPGVKDEDPAVGLRFTSVPVLPPLKVCDPFV